MTGRFGRQGDQVVCVVNGVFDGIGDNSSSEVDQAMSGSVNVSLMLRSGFGQAHIRYRFSPARNNVEVHRWL